MNQTGEQQWQQQEYDATNTMTNDPFNTFLNIDATDDILDFDFGADLGDPSLSLQNVSAEQQIPLHEHHHQHQQQSLQHNVNVNKHMMDAPDFSALGLGQFTQMQPAPSHILQQYQPQPHPSQQQQQQNYGTPTLMDFGADQQFQQPHNTFNTSMSMQEYQPQQHYSVPPTPNSAKGYPGSAQFPVNNLPQQSIYNSPHHFQMNNVANQHAVEVMTDYSMSGYAMSPLGSPAIFPQNNGHHIMYSHPHTAESSLAGSPTPIDLNGEANGNDMPVERPRKTRKKATPQTMRSRQTIAPKSRKQSLTGIVDKHIIFPHPENVQQPTHASQMTTDQNQTNTPPRSASSEMSMPPPPKPGSADGCVAAPSATPASIMKYRPTSQSGSASGTPYMSPMIQQQDHGVMDTPVISMLGPGFEDLHLPDATLPQENMARHVTPRILNGNKAGTPMMLPKLTSARGTPRPEVFQSPSVVSLKEAGRNSRKRNSTGSTLASPALLPKISPSIKPLLPEGHGMTNDTHALLLASKSNYQNLIEGNTLPGVSYPADLSTNLTSKRTSHKIAEQGRRNRINTALQELAALIPPNFSTGKDGSHSSGDGDGGSPEAEEEGKKTGGKPPATPTNQSSSKAATVEQATAYIKVMQAERKEMEALHAQMKEELEALKAASKSE